MVLARIGRDVIERSRDEPTLGRIWDSEISRHVAAGPRAPTWSAFTFDELAARPLEATPTSAELEFASRLVSFLATLPKDRDPRRPLISLLDVNGYVPVDLQPHAAAGSLQLLAAEPAGDLRTVREVFASPEVLRIADDLKTVADVRPRGETFVNVGLDALDAPGAERSLETVDGGQTLWLWAELGPRNPAAVAGEPLALVPARLVDGEELEIVVFPDRGVTVEPDSGRVRIASGQPFAVVRAASTLAPASPAATRLYFRLTLPAGPETKRVRVAVYLRGVLVHVEQLTLPIGLGRPPVVRTTHQLTRTYDAKDRFATLTAPTVSIYANANDETHDFSFYLPGRTEAEPGIPAQLHLDSNGVVGAITAARETLRKISWNSTEEFNEQSPQGSRFPRDEQGNFGTVPDVTQALIDLAVVGYDLWTYFALELERTPEFLGRFREAMRPPGTVQLGIKEHPSAVFPLQVIYDRALDNSAPGFLRLCDASAAWLAQPDSEPPCLGRTCPQDQNKQYVCIAGFWGIRHGIALNPAYRTAELRSAVPSGPKPVATLGRTTDKDVVRLWPSHLAQLKHSLDVLSEPATTAAPLLQSLSTDHSLVLYLLAHVKSLTASPYIYLTQGFGGSINHSTLEGMAPMPQQPLVFLNACSSAGLTPERLLDLINTFFLYGAGGAVGTEISIFVDFATVFAETMFKSYAAGESLAQALRLARVDGLRHRNPMGFAYAGYGLHDMRIVHG